jgi:hypothetical protein
MDNIKVRVTKSTIYKIRAGLDMTLRVTLILCLSNNVLHGEVMSALQKKIICDFWILLKVLEVIHS